MNDMSRETGDCGGLSAKVSTAPVASKEAQEECLSRPETGNWVDHIIDTPSRELGPRISYAIKNDPRRLVFTLSRYKFVSKMLVGKSSVLEVGCGESFGSPIVAQSVKSLTCIDIEPRLIECNIRRMNDLEKMNWKIHDIISGPVSGEFDAAYSLDVLEHIPFANEEAFFKNIIKSLKKDAVFIVGVPNISADKYASKPGHSPHVNLKSEESLRASFAPYFVNTFIFGMNDEVVHTGFSPMAHYLFAMGVGLKS